MKSAKAEASESLVFIAIKVENRIECEAAVQMKPRPWLRTSSNRKGTEQKALHTLLPWGLRISIEGW